MNKIIFAFLGLLLFSCNQTQTKKEVNYSDYINSQSLNRQVVDLYPDGQERAVIFTIKDVSNKKPVKEIHFFDNGNVQVEGTLKEGKRHGIWTFYHKNGQIWSTGNFNMGKSMGEFDIFDEQGQIRFKYYYDNGEALKQEIFLKGKLYKTIDLPKHDNKTLQ